MRHLIKFYLPIICILLSCTNAIAHGENKMELKNLYEKDDVESAISLEGQAFKLGGLFGGYSNILIFPVPQDNAVGTNYMGKGITIISFPNGKIDYDRYFRNVDDIEGSGKYMPPISSELIGFGQVRVFNLFDFKKKIHREYHIVFPFTKYIENIAVADAGRRRLIFEIESQKENAKDPFDVNKSLLLVDLSGNTAELIKELHKEPGTIWITTKDRVILYRIIERELIVLDMNLEPAHHPLEDVVRKHKDQLNPVKDGIGFSRIKVHPYLPFAILHGGDKGSTYIGWATDRNSEPHLLLRRTKEFSFSPDGKWVVYTQNFGQDKKRTYIMPVSEKYPHYLGSPILISKKTFKSGFGAWTTNPTGYVGTWLDEIYHWDLENRDFPGKGKMSFHDYIVQEDLKKLTREKRQGLGN